MGVELPAGAGARGDLELLELPLAGLFCSGRCPGDLILGAYDLARGLREGGVGVVGGFQTPVERDCLEILLRGSQPVVVCPARGVGGMRLPRAWRGPLAEGRLLVVSPFDDAQRRATARLAAARNRFAAGLARWLLVVHAAPGGRTEDMARRALARGAPVLTLASASNAGLAALGARVGSVDELVDAVGGGGS